MNSRFAIFGFILFGLSIAIGVFAFNYSVDSMCYFRCGQIDTHKKTLNTYYRMAQIAMSFPDTESVLIGSSRGQQTSPQWIEKVTGFKALNLSIGGAELRAKLAFLNVTLANNKIKQVIWQADFFENIGEVADEKIRRTPALKNLTPEFENYFSPLDLLATLIDHETLESSIKILGRGHLPEIDRGSSSDSDFERCRNPEFPREISDDVLNKAIAEDYQRYVTAIFKADPLPAYFEIFSQKIKSIAENNVSVLIFIAPYHPTFMRKLMAEKPHIYQEHLTWIKNLKALTGKNIKVLNFF